MMPLRFSCNATRALVASFGQEQYRTISRPRGSSSCRRSISSATIQSAPGMAYGAAFTSSTERVSTTASVSSPMSRRPLSSSGVIPRGPETAEKPPALDDLDHDVTRERRPDDDDDPVAEVTGT